ncbi:MAG: hypothetical protein GXO36_05710, partial [Chloroflexi bacterium]|nr:hypothetical protein [Chloroflexota bacterium]
AYALPIPWGLNLTLLLHLAWGSLGWGCWARGKGLRAWPVFGLVAGLLPKTMAHTLGGHVTLVYATAWMPWLVRASERARPGPWPGVVLALIALADPRAAVLALPLMAFAAWHGERRAWLGRVLGWTGLAALLAAPLALPLAVFTSHSPRGTMSFEDRTVYSIPVPLFVAEFGGALPLHPSLVTEYRIYIPWSVTLLAWVAWNRGKAKRWLALAGLAALLALGRYGPLAPLWYLPGLTWIRVPARFGWVLAFALLMAASHGIHATPVPPSSRYRLGWLAWGLGGLLLRIVGWPLLFARYIHLGAYALAGLADAYAWFSLRPGTRRVAEGRLWAAALLASLATIYPYVNVKPLSSVEAQDARLAQAVLRDAGLDQRAWAERWTGPRVYSPIYSIGQWTAARVGLPLAYGVDPLYTTSWATWLIEASRIPRHKYSVVLPPWVEKESVSELRKVASRPNLRQLAEARVGYIASIFPLDSPEAQPLGRVAGAWLYRYPKPCPMAWVEPPERPGCEGARVAQVLQWTPNRVVLRAQGPGRLVLSEGAYPTWRVRIDGQPAAPDPTREPWRAVVLPPGEHRVEWTLRPWDGLLGWTIAGITSLGLAAYAARRPRLTREDEP